MRYTTQASRKKLSLIAISSIICFVIIICRLVSLQIYHHQRLNQLGQKNFTRIKQIEPLRGNILDCKGQILVTNRPITHIDWIGSGLPKLNSEQRLTLQKIELIIDKHHQSTITPLAKINRAEKFGTTMRLVSDLNMQALSEISEQCADCENISISTHFKRFYPHKNLACHILGYFGDINNPNSQSSGKMGLERIFEDSLRGKDGSMSHIINSFGRNLQINPLTSSQSGKNLVITIDTSLQEIAESVMPDDLAGAFILLDPHTGGIKALVSKPGFDPSIFLKSISADEWKDLQINRPFINRAFNASYPPASIYKLVTIAAALEENIINQDTTFCCNGFTLYKGRKYYCNRRYGHGKLNVKDNLAYSCNIGCFEIAKTISIDTLADYSYRFGLGEKTNIIFPESSGLIPSNAWKRIVKGEPWWKGETLSASIGQSFLLTTPIQIACMIGSIFKGYLVKPRILENDEIIKTPIDISTTTLNFLQDCMQSAIATGTGKNLNRLKNITIYAKTGTVQTRSRFLDTKERQKNCHAWFVSYFYHHDHEPFVMVILMEHAGSSSVTTNVAKQFLTQYIKSVI